MTPFDLLTYFKTQAHAARCLGCAQSSIAEWVDKGRIPDGRQYQIQLATAGKLVADRPALRSAGDSVACADRHAYGGAPLPPGAAAEEASHE